MGNFKNRFAYSVSRANTLKTCPRQYYLSYYGHWNGWLGGASKIRRETYRLKQLTGLKAWAGNLVHQEIEAILRDALNNQEYNLEKSIDRMGKRAKIQFNISERRAKNPRSPAKDFGLKEHEYGTIEKEDKRDAWEIAKSCMHVFFEMDYIDRVVAAGKDNILSIDSFSTFPVRIDSDTEVPVFSMPDLAFRENGGVTITDWKTGKEKDEYEDQVALYSLYAKRYWKVDPTNVQCELVYLRTGNIIDKKATPEWIQAAEDRIRLEAREMMGMLVNMDPEKNEALPATKFPPKKNPLCSWCNYERICGVDDILAGRPDPLAV